MQTEPLSQQIEVACFLMAVLVGLYFLPSNEELAARFRKWKAKRAEQKKAARHRQKH